ncbi:MAG: leucine-rich repeat domain-containing protein [Clostridia bacterium]|nr:leucine-rich repeat domain-containing protein [Clostridia bacterium]
MAGLSACTYKATTKDGLIIECYYVIDECWVVGIENREVTNVVIPSKYKNKNVNGIGKFAFSSCKKLESITIPDSITYIRDSAFSNCVNLKRISIPDSVTDMGVDVFKNCDGVIQNENSVQYVDNWVVSCDTDSISGPLTLRNGTKGIANRVFRGCTDLTEIYLPDSVKSVGEGLFYNCTNLANIRLSNQIPSLPYYRYVDDENNEDSTDYRDYQVRGLPTPPEWVYEGFFENCTSLTSITIPNGIKEIDDYAFKNCSSLTSIKIGSGVTYISESAFENCLNNIESLTVDGNNKTYRSSGNCIITTQSKTLKFGCKNSVIPTDGSVTNIRSYAFENCREITEVSIPSTVTSIERNAFYGCTGIKENEDGVIYVDNWAIGYSSEIRDNVTLRSGTKGIADYTFNGCRAFHNFSIPDSVNYICRYAFSDCISLNSITIPKSVVSIESYAFNDCKSLDGVTIQNGVASIGSYAFNGCDYLENVSIPNSVTVIGEAAFEDCISLKSISFPDSVTAISDNTFRGCSSLTSVTIPKSVTTIGDSAFNDCFRLKSISIPDSVTTIGCAAFSDCSSLSSITIPRSVTTIEAWAFNGCSELTSVIFEDTVGWQRSCGIKNEIVRKIKSADLSDAKKAAKLINEEYHKFMGSTYYYTWTKSTN